MVVFITYLRALATCLITNSHYVGIYPSDIIANGGLVGDMIFFAVSGYCLYNIKLPFHKWYTKRLFRVYTPVWIITLVFMVLGCISNSDYSFVQLFVYPTEYHFVASIVTLYIPYFVLIRCDYTRERISVIMFLLFCKMTICYLTTYDASYYHIDNVREPFIRFLFMEGMLLGAYFKQNDHLFKNKFSWKWMACLASAFVMYFVSKVLFSKCDEISEYQIINQVLIFVLTYTVFRVFAGLNEVLERRTPKVILKCVSYIAQITLEIYVVQYVLIEFLKAKMPFPINWFVVTGSILVTAVLLHCVCKVVLAAFDRLIKDLLKKDT